MCKLQIFSGFAALDLRMWKIICNFASEKQKATTIVTFGF